MGWIIMDKETANDIVSWISDKQKRLRQMKQEIHLLADETRRQTMIDMMTASGGKLIGADMEMIADRIIEYAATLAVADAVCHIVCGDIMKQTTPAIHRVLEGKEPFSRPF